MVSTEITSLDSMHPDASELAPECVRRAQAGDERAFHELYQLHRGSVARLAARMVGPRGDVEDVIQEVFIQVFRSLARFRGESRFSTWLHRVTVNVTLMHLRGGRHRREVADEDAPEPVAPEEDSPLAGAARNERLRALYRILDGISEKKRLAFVLHDLEGMAAEQIAQIVEAPVLTVRTRLFYARREVYQAMAQDPTLDAIARDLGLGPGERSGP